MLIEKIEEDNKKFKEEITLENLTAMVAHEFKNPIALIKANIEFLMYIEKDLIGIKNYKIINNQLNKLLDLANEFTNLMKYHNERKINVYLYDLLHSVYEDYKESYDEINFEFVCEEEDISINGNFMLIDIAIRNLVKNSIEAFEESEDLDEKKITLTLEKFDEITRIKIEDNGCGFSKMTTKEAMKKYKTTKERGTGLGLYIVEYIIKEHNGYFEITNNEKGCIATILL